MTAASLILEQVAKARVGMTIIKVATTVDLLEVLKVATKRIQTMALLHPRAIATPVSHQAGMVAQTATPIEEAIIIMVVAVAGETPLVAGTDPEN